MEWTYLVWAVSGAIAAELVRSGLERLRTFRGSVKRKLSLTLSYHPEHHSVIFGIQNNTMADVVVDRVVSQFAAANQRRQFRRLGIPQFPPLDLAWANMFGLEGGFGSMGDRVLPGGAGLFTAGHEALSKQFPTASKLKVSLYLKDGPILRGRLNLDRLRRAHANGPPAYVPRPGERLVKSSHMNQVIPSYPPRIEPAVEIVREIEGDEVDAENQSR